MRNPRQDPSPPSGLLGRGGPPPHPLAPSTEQSVEPGHDFTPPTQRPTRPDAADTNQTAQTTEEQINRPQESASEARSSFRGYVSQPCLESKSNGLLCASSRCFATARSRTHCLRPCVSCLCSSVLFFFSRMKVVFVLQIHWRGSETND